MKLALAVLVVLGSASPILLAPSTSQAQSAAHPDQPPAAPAQPVALAAAAPAPAAAPSISSAARTASPLTARPAQPASWRLMLSDLTVLRANPLGLETRGRFGLQKRLYSSSSKATENNFAFFGLYPKLNPMSAHLAAGGELQPLSIFNLRATAEVQRYVGALGFLQSFTSPTANYSDATLDDLADSARAATVFHASIQPMLQMRVGPIALRALIQLDYWDMDLRDGDTAAYEATFDTLLPDEGWTLSTDSDVLYTGYPGLAIGLRHSYVRPIYTEKHFINQLDEGAYDGDNAHQRLGLFAAYTFHDRGPSTFNKPTVILIASCYLSHRFRTGEPDVLPIGARPDDYTSRAFPYLLAGFAFESDFLAARY